MTTAPASREQMTAFVEACVAAASDYRARMNLSATYPVIVSAPEWMVGDGPGWLDAALFANHIALSEPES